MNYDLCSGTCLKKSGIYSVAMFQKAPYALRRALFYCRILILSAFHLVIIVIINTLQCCRVFLNIALD